MTDNDKPDPITEQEVEQLDHEEIIRIADDVLAAALEEIERGRARLRNALARYEERMRGRTQ